MSLREALPAFPPRRVAVVRTGAIGDTVHVLPVLASLRRAWPEVELAWAIQPVPFGLHRGHPDVSRFLVFRRERGLAGLLEFRRLVRGERFDLVLVLHPYLKAGLVTALLDAPVKLGFDRARAPDFNWLFTTHRIPPGPPAHVQDQFFEFLEPLGVPVVREWDFHFTGEEREARRAFFGSLDRPALAVLLRSSRAAKDWTLERYARVLEIADRDLGLQPMLVGGDSARERSAAARIRDLARARLRDERADDLRRLAWLLDGSAALLSPDSGPLHVAVALGTPTVGLYGATDPRRSGPYRRFGDLVVDSFGRPGETRPSAEERPGRMARITVEEVAEKLERAVRRYVRGQETNGAPEGGPRWRMER